MPRSKAQKIAAGRYRSPKPHYQRELHREGRNSGSPGHSPEYLTWRRELFEKKIEDMRAELSTHGIEHPKEEPCSNSTDAPASES